MLSALAAAAEVVVVKPVVQLDVFHGAMERRVGGESERRRNRGRAAGCGAGSSGHASRARDLGVVWFRVLICQTLPLLQVAVE